MDGDRVLIGRCYTRARRIPLMIGRLPGVDGQLWGGPYTVTQFVVFCVGVAVMWQTRALWGHLGLGWNGVLLLGLPALAAWAVRRARVDGRDPLRAAAGIAAFLTAPATGRLAGRAWRPPTARAAATGRFFTNPTFVEMPAEMSMEERFSGGRRLVDTPVAARPTTQPPKGPTDSATIRTACPASRVEQLLAAARALQLEAQRNEHGEGRL